MRCVCTGALACALLSAQVSIELADGKAPLEANQLVSLRVSIPARSESGLRPELPSVWLDVEPSAQVTLSQAACESRVRSLRNAGPLNSALIDFNLYYLVALDDAGVIRILDPRNSFGGSRLMAQLDLGAGAVNWAFLAGKHRMFITAPDQNRLFVVDTGKWTVLAQVAVERPSTSIAADTDGEAVWVGRGGEHPALLRVTAEGAIAQEHPVSGPAHQIVAADGGVAAVAGQQLLLPGNKKVEGVVRIAWSAAARAFVALRNDGSLQMVEPDGDVVHTATAASELDDNLELTPDGRWAVVWSSRRSNLRIFDSSRRSWRGELVLEHPQEVSFTANYLYARSRVRPEVLLVAQAMLDKPGAVAGKLIAGGTAPHIGIAASSMAAVEAAPLMFWTNSEDRQIYVYHEGMNAVSGTLRMPAGTPRALAIAGPRLREEQPGLYTASFTFPEPGRYLVSVLDAQQRLTTCRTFQVGGKRMKAVDVQVSARNWSGRAIARQPFRFTFDLQPERPAGVQALDAVLLTATGQSPQRASASPTPDGGYTVQFPGTPLGFYWLLIRLPDDARSGRPRWARFPLRVHEKEN